MDDAADYDFFATIRTPNVVVKRVRCRLWLPKRLEDDPRLRFYPTEKQSALFLGGEWSPYSIRAKVERSEHQTTTIAADEVWTETVPRRSLTSAATKLFSTERRGTCACLTHG